jgi:hypothetical protein
MEEENLSEEELFEVQSNLEDEMMLKLLTPSGHIPTPDGDPIDIPGIE